MATENINIAELIADKIKVRYAEITERTVGSANMVVDAFYPTYVRDSLLGGSSQKNLGKKCSAISPFLANELGVFKVPFEDIVKMLGYKKIELKAMLEKLKDKKLTLVLAGLGGTGMNFMHWAEEVCNYTNTVSIFDKIEIWDKDSVDLTNIFRFPQILNPEKAYGIDYTMSTIRKVDMINKSSILSRTQLLTQRYFITNESICDIKTRDFDANGNIVKLDEAVLVLSEYHKDKIFYGAPDIATREMFSKHKELKFISGTHGDDDCQLYIKPMQDTSIQIESYGMINLSVFFMNQVKMTLSFLELLASDTDLSEPHLVMEYSFSKEYTEGRINKAGLNRTYNFPIVQSNTIDQEDGLESESQHEEAEELSEPQDSNAEETTADTDSEALSSSFTFELRPQIPDPSPDTDLQEGMVLQHNGEAFVYTDETIVEPPLPLVAVSDVHASNYIEQAIASEEQEEETPTATRRRRRTRAEMEAARAEARAAAESELLESLSVVSTTTATTYTYVPAVEATSNNDTYIYSASTERYQEAEDV